MLVWLRNLTLGVALFCAIGGHWAILQSVAWANMFAAHARCESVQSALNDTFDGRHLCPLCRKIIQGRRAEHKSDVQAAFKQLEFLNDCRRFVISPPSHFRLLPAAHYQARLLSHAPPTPPPRFFFA